MVVNNDQILIICIQIITICLSIPKSGIIQFLYLSENFYKLHGYGKMMIVVKKRKKGFR